MSILHCMLLQSFHSFLSGLVHRNQSQSKVDCQSALQRLTAEWNAGGRRGQGRGGRGGRGRGNSKPRSKEDLDAELDAYNKQDAKHAQTQLNNDLDDYFKDKSTKKPAAQEANGNAAVEEAS